MKKKMMALALATCFAAAVSAQEETSRYMNIHLKSGEVQNVALSEIDSLTFGDAVEQNTVTFDLELIENNCTYVTYKITPSDKDVTYFQTMLMKEKYDTEKESHGGNIWGFDKAWYEWIAEIYNSGEWYDYMKQYSDKGDIVVETDPYDNLMRWGTDYVLYCYAIDDEGNQISAVKELEFKTGTSAPSDNVITVELSNITQKSVDLNITTTNDDQYFVTAQKKSSVDNFENDDELVWSMMEQLYSSPMYFKNGNFTGNEGFSYLTPDTDYVLLVFGFDESPTTSVQKIPFHTLPKE